MKTIIISHLFLLGAFVPVLAWCPSEELLTPCTCDGRQNITCVGVSASVLEQMFNRLDQGLGPEQKELEHFYLKSTDIKELDISIFKSITFRAISLIGTTLSSFSSLQTPVPTLSTTQDVFLFDNPLLSDTSVVSFAKSFLALHTFNEKNNSFFKNVVNNAFDTKGHTHDKLEQLTLDSPKTIHSFAFESLNRLLVLNLGPELNIIEGNAFSFAEPSDNGFYVTTLSEKLSSEGFLTGSLADIKRYTGINLYYKPLMTYLKEDVFKSFFDTHPSNRILFNPGPTGLDCQNCRNYWIYSGQYEKRIHSNGVGDWVCSSGKRFDDQGNFEGCK